MFTDKVMFQRHIHAMFRSVSDIINIISSDQLCCCDVSAAHADVLPGISHLVFCILTSGLVYATKRLGQENMDSGERHSFTTMKHVSERTTSSVGLFFLKSLSFNFMKTLLVSDTTSSLRFLRVTAFWNPTEQISKVWQFYEVKIFHITS